MATRHIHCLIVARAAERGIPWTWGVISGLDLVRMAGAASGDSTAQDIASTEAVRVSSNDRLDHAAQLMLDHQVEHLIVVGAEHGRPVGVLSTLDIAGILACGEA